MAKHVSPCLYMVVYDGVPLFRGLPSEQEARRRAERWQVGLLKRADKGDWIEVKRDHAAEKEFDERHDDMERGNPQKVTVIHDWR